MRQGQGSPQHFVQVGGAAPGQGPNRHKAESSRNPERSPHSCPWTPREGLAWKRTRDGGGLGSEAPSHPGAHPVLGSLAQPQGQRGKAVWCPHAGHLSSADFRAAPLPGTLSEGRVLGLNPQYQAAAGVGDLTSHRPLSYPRLLVTSERGPSFSVWRVLPTHPTGSLSLGPLSKAAGPGPPFIYWLTRSLFNRCVLGTRAGHKDDRSPNPCSAPPPRAIKASTKVCAELHLQRDFLKCRHLGPEPGEL